MNVITPQDQSQQQLSKCTQDILLQGFAFLFFLTAGLYGAQKQNVVLPFIAAPSASAAFAKLSTAIQKRQQLRNKLRD